MPHEKLPFQSHPLEHSSSTGGGENPDCDPAFVTQPEDYYFRAYYHMRGPVGIFHRMRINRLMGYVPPNSSVLDLGCGSGVLLYLLRQNGCSVAGVDIRQECVEFTRRACGEGDFRCGDIRELDMGRTFDAVFCTEVMEHCDRESRGKILDVIRLHTRVGGLAVITFPSGIYMALEPVWRILRKVTSPGLTFDDEGIHQRLGHREVEDGLCHKGFVLTSSGLQCLGVIRCIVAQRSVEGR